MKEGKKVGSWEGRKEGRKKKTLAWLHDFLCMKPFVCLRFADLLAEVNYLPSDRSVALRPIPVGWVVGCW